MGLFKKSQPKAAQVPAPPPLQVDSTLGSEPLRRFSAALTAAQWAEAELILRGSTAADAIFIASAVRTEGHLRSAVAVWARIAPSPRSESMHAAMLVADAWEARGRLRAESTTASQFEEFHRRLRSAEDALVSCAMRWPDQPVAWFALLDTSKGLSLSKVEIAGRLQRAHAAAGGSLVLHSSALNVLSGRWRGDRNAMMDYAAEFGASAPVGSPLHALVPLAHIEHALDGGLDMYEYFPGHAEEIRLAGVRSVQTAEFSAQGDTPDALIARNIFALAYRLAGDQALASVQRRLIGNRVSSIPWMYWGDDLGATFTRLG